eukprot:m51a1_g7162 hypothetical protein (1188) ;mRNA; f:37299-42336
MIGGTTRGQLAERTLQALVDATPEFGKDVELRLVETMEDPHMAGWSITTHQQTIDGIPVAVWNAEGEVVSVTGTTVADAHERTHLRARTAVSHEEVVGVAQRAAEAKDSQAKCGLARRVVLRPGMANGEPGPNLPAWEVLCGTADVYVSTQTPSVLALNPRTSHLVSAIYDKPTGAVLWQTGQPFPADSEIKTLVDGLEVAERLWKEFSGRDGYDNRGSSIEVNMHLNVSGAFYKQRTISFGVEYASQSILWHEYAHGITEYLDRAEQCRQQKAGSSKTFTGLRDMWQPSCVTLSDAIKYPSTVPEMFCHPYDNAGVHINSVIPSRTFALLSDGSSRHDFKGVGVDTAMKIFTRAKFLATPMTTFAQYATYLSIACAQLRTADSTAVSQGTCTSVAQAMAATELDHFMPCFSATPSFHIKESSYPVVPRVFVSGAIGSRVTLFVGGNFSGATLQWSSGSIGRCDTWGAKAFHFDRSANSSSPIWAYQVPCPVPDASVLSAQSFIAHLDNADAASDISLAVYWAPVSVLDSAVFVPSVGIDIYSPNVLPEAHGLACELGEDEEPVPCLNIFLCREESATPGLSRSCSRYQSSELRVNATGVLRARPAQAVARGKYFVYMSQHGTWPVSNSVVMLVKNAGVSLRVCVEIEGARVVVSEELYGSVEAQTDHSGCAAFELEQNVEYSITATKGDHVVRDWRHTSTRSTDMVRISMVRSAAERSATALGLALLCALEAVIANAVQVGALVAVTDGGGTLERHGSFVAAAFVVVFAVIAALCATACAVYAALRTGRNRVVACVAALVVLAVVGAPLEARNRESWIRGLAGKRLVEDNPACPFTPPRWDPMALWPSPVFRSLTDRPCAGTGSVPGAQFAGGSFAMGCRGRVTVFPSDLGWNPPEDNYRAAVFPAEVLQHAIVHDYDRPGELLPVPATAADVLAECSGRPESRQLVFRGVRNETAVAAAKSIAATHGAPREVPRLNVLLLFIDGLSRRKFAEWLPESARAASTSPTHDLFQFFRYNALSRVTYANFEALWRREGGMSMWEYARSCGYVSAYVPEQCEWRMYLDFAGHPDFWPMEPFCLPEYQPPTEQSTFLLGPYSSVRRCIAGEQVHAHAIRALSSWWDKHADVPKVAWNTFLENHEPSTNVIRHIDAELLRVIGGRVVNITDTIVLVLSDHGPHTTLGYVFGE